MADQPHRTDLRRSDPSDLEDDVPMPSQGGGGGGLAAEIGSQDELDEAEGFADGVTRVRKSNKVQPVPQRKTGHEPSSF